MNPVTSILEDIRTNYSVFEKDQVLTHNQLNTVAEYFEDQTRLTRTKLLGVGIVCGLRVGLKGTSVTVSKGAGVTTDGDLLYFQNDTVFDQFKPYGDSDPKYSPFADALKTKKVYELLPKVPAAQRDPLGIDLSQFASETGGVVEDTVAVLFMEGYVKDEDLCTGTDCDNLGQKFINTIKLLVMPKAAAAGLKEAIATPDRTSQTLGVLAVDRPLIPPGIDSTAKLAALYRAACKSIHNKLTAEFAKLGKNFWTSLDDRFPSDAAAGWTASLNKAKNSYASSDAGIQYYYDFLKDVAETYNHFRQLLFGDLTWCCPDGDIFPKHLLLGSPASGDDSDENRSGLYPSPMLSRTVEQLNHARFLAQKLDTLVETFQVPPVTDVTRITPSCFEDCRLEDRAIPYYFRIDPANPAQRWNYRLHLQGMDNRNYSYNAALYGGEGGAANPLTSQIGSFSFFRVEGHLGQNVSKAKTDIQSLITTMNLPFAVRSVLLGADKTKIVTKPGIRYDDLHRFHQVLRKDLVYQLGDVKTLSTHYANQVSTALTADDVDDLPQAKIVAAQKDQTISDGVLSATGVLNQGYASYRANPVWKPAIKDTVTAAAEFKQNLGNVTKTDFTTPFDSLIGTSHANWLDWVDIHIKDKDEKENNKLLFSNFQLLHPALEHFAGVVRGGTFILVYDEGNQVVADFMLPYYESDPVTEVEPQEPILPLPPIKNPGVILGGIKLTPSPDKFLAGKLVAFTHNVIDPKIDIQKDQIGLFKDSITTIAGVFSGVKANAAIQPTGTKFNDSLLDAAVVETKKKQQAVEILNENAINPGFSQESRDKYAALAKEAENELAISIQDTTRYVADSGTDVSSGSEGFAAITEMSKSMGAIRDPGALTTVRTGLTEVKNTTANPELKVALTGMTRF